MVGGWTGDDDLPTGWTQYRTAHEATSALEDAGTHNDDSIVKDCPSGRSGNQSGIPARCVGDEGHHVEVRPESQTHSLLHRVTAVSNLKTRGKELGKKQRDCNRKSIRLD